MYNVVCVRLKVQYYIMNFSTCLVSCFGCFTINGKPSNQNNEVLCLTIKNTKNRMESLWLKVFIPTITRRKKYVL